ncbi:MANNAN ENDO-14-BETA-MANNOSIDASE 1 [Salix koriyanagi]|uniref:mannan endo-1,4-beta-mannosidase n=1 Tax=Salix koriyanagi TaxID=2511006 RepID=A0A9Q0YU34_9ROSI|nr:MANNAN ENDO-14-BETA-MANNOSIDASE 1 [Salix koriyanagi]
MKWSSSLFSMALLIIFHHGQYCCQADQSYPARCVFAKTNGTHFVMNNRPLYLNGFNAFWMMYMSSDPSTRTKVTSAFQQASKHGMNIARTWAFSDGGNDKPLQISPGIYNEDMFEGLDFVVSEARKHGIYLILSLVNNFKDYGGISQYVEWARERGQQLSDNDEFYTNTAVKEYYKNHVEAVLTRMNSITGVAYKDDPTIFAWELINEPRSNDTSGKLVQEWIKEMAAHVKSIDNDHLLEIGLEGFYGESKKESNPGNSLFGTDFISSNQIPHIDFATIHLYPEQWLLNSSEDEQASFVDRWIEAHIQDSSSVLGKPLIIAEFGRSSKLPGYSQQKRDSYFVKIYSDIYSSVTGGGPFSGGLFWQLMAQGMESWGDGYEVVLEDCPSSTANIIDLQSRKLQSLHTSDYS